MRCITCGKKMKERKGRYHFLASGLSNVYLDNVTFFVCSCGEEMPALSCLDDLLGRIASEVVRGSPRLSGEEIRFLRKWLGLKSTDFAKMLGVSKVSVSRWENNKTAIDKSYDRTIRALVISRDFRQALEEMNRQGRGQSSRPRRYLLDAQVLCSEPARTAP